jgi:methylphosphotriester-DNA--protein-cysteine methyltransferase
MTEIYLDDCWVNTKTRTYHRKGHNHCCYALEISKNLMLIGNAFDAEAKTYRPCKFCYPERYKDYAFNPAVKSKKDWLRYTRRA